MVETRGKEKERFYSSLSPSENLTVCFNHVLCKNTRKRSYSLNFRLLISSAQIRSVITFILRAIHSAEHRRASTCPNKTVDQFFASEQTVSYKCLESSMLKRLRVTIILETKRSTQSDFQEAIFADSLVLSSFSRARVSDGNKNNRYATRIHKEWKIARLPINSMLYNLLFISQLCLQLFIAKYSSLLSKLSDAGLGDDAPSTRRRDLT